MKFPTLYTAFVLSLATLLSACGAGNPDSLATSTAVTAEAGAVTTVSSSAASTAPAVQPGTVTNVTTVTVDAPQTGTTAPAQAGPIAAASATMPAPDCAAEGCAGPRIIDGNAEAYRYAAMQRAALEAASS